jgi:hypothetical protein
MGGALADSARNEAAGALKREVAQDVDDAVHLATIPRGCSVGANRAIMRGHEASAASPDARAAPTRLPVVLGSLRALPASQAGRLHPIHHSLGPPRLQRSATALRALREMRREGGRLAASKLVRRTGPLGAVSALTQNFTLGMSAQFFTPKS